MTYQKIIRTALMFSLIVISLFFVLAAPPVSTFFGSVTINSVASTTAKVIALNSSGSSLSQTLGAYCGANYVACYYLDIPCDSGTTLTLKVYDITGSSPTCSQGAVTNTNLSVSTLAALSACTYNQSCSGGYCCNGSTSIMDGSGSGKCQASACSIPQITIDAPSNQTYNKSSIGFNVTLAETGYTCFMQLDSMANVSLTKQNATAFNYTNSSMADAFHYAIFSCNDSENDWNNTAKIYFTVDTTKPTINFTASTVSGGNYSQNAIWANITASDTYLKTIVIYLTNTTGLVNSSSGTTSPKSINFTGLSDGTYYLNATANDTVGNSNSTETRTIFLDTTYPQINYSAPTEINATNFSRTWIAINITVTETYEKNITFYLYNSTGTANTSTSTASQRFINFTGLSDGNYTYKVTICDITSNCNTTSIRAITLDTTVPSVTLVSPASGTDTTTTSQTFSCNATDNVNLLNITLIIWTTSAELTANSTSVSGTSNSTSFAYTFASTGTYYWNCKAFDKLNNSAWASSNNTIIISAASTTTTGGGGGGTTTTYNIGAVTETGASQQISSGDKISFSFNNTSYTLTATSVSSSSGAATISGTSYTFSVGGTNKIDLDGDGYYDISVTLSSSTSSKVTYKVSKIHEKVSIITPPVTNETRICGNSIVETGETCASCPDDVKCASDEECKDNACVPKEVTPLKQIKNIIIIIITGVITISLIMIIIKHLIKGTKMPRKRKFGFH